MTSLESSFSKEDHEFYEREFAFFNEVTGISGTLRSVLHEPKEVKKPEPPKPEPPKQEVKKPEPPKPETPKQEAKKPEPAKQEPKKPEAEKKPDTSQPATALGQPLQLRGACRRGAAPWRRPARALRRRSAAADPGRARPHPGSGARRHCHLVADDTPGGPAPG